MEASLARRQNQNMVLGQLYTNDIIEPRLLSALSAVPRELFLNGPISRAAYTDEDIEVQPGRYMLAPLTLAKLLAISEITPACRVLCIGCTTGYVAAIVSKLASHVVSIDSDAMAVRRAAERIRELAIINADIQHVPYLAEGCPIFAPYDVIIVNGAVDVMPEALGNQLALGGRLAAILRKSSRPGDRGGLGKGLLVKRVDGKLQHREHFDASANVLPGFERKPGFVF